jgi:hypothetical protein
MTHQIDGPAHAADSLGEYTIVHTIADMGDEWRDISAMLPWTPEWLAISEDEPGNRSRYMVQRSGTATQAGIVWHITDGSGWELVDPVHLLLTAPPPPSPIGDKELVELTEAQSRVDPSLMYPAAVSMLPAAYKPGLARTTGADAPYIDEMLDRYESSARAEGARSVAVMYVSETDRVLQQVLRSRGYSAIRSMVDCVLHIQWASIDEYLEWLPAKRRRKIRRERQDFAASGLQVVTADLDTIGRRHAELFGDHMRRYGHSMSTEEAVERLDSILGHLGPWCHLLEARRGDAIEGFIVYYLADGAIYAKVIGIGDAPGNPFLYFNIGYYALLEAAIANGASSISYGPEAYDAKALRGCTPELRTSYLLSSGASASQIERIAVPLLSDTRERMAGYPWDPRLIGSLVPEIVADDEIGESQ